MAGPSPHNRVIRFFGRLPVVASFFAAIVGSAVLVRWWLDLEGLRNIMPAHIEMLPVTALTFVLAGTSLWLNATSPVEHWGRTAAPVFGALVFGVGAFTMLEYLMDRNLGLDLLLFGDKVLAAPWRPPGRMASNSAAACLLGGAGLLSIPHDDRVRGFRTQIFSSLAMLIAFLALTGYAFGVTNFYSVAQYSGMAMITAVTFLVLNLGIFFAVRHRGLPRLLVDEGSAGMLARRLIPAAILVPWTLGALRLVGERMGMYESAFGVSLYVVLAIAIFIWLVAWCARVVRSAESVKSDFLAVMSHELRTPLSAIIGYEELLADGITGPVNSAQHQQLTRIKASARHLLDLIDQVLTYSRTEAGREEIYRAPVNINTVLEETAELVEPLIAEKQIGFLVTTFPEPLIVITDAGKVRQILLNLLSNAVKFTDAGNVTLSAGTVDGKVHLTVRDTGIGIAPEYVERVFDPFWQVEQKATRRVGGTGLGLSVSRRLALLLGGDVTVESTRGTGSVFTLVLPVTVPPASQRD